MRLDLSKILLERERSQTGKPIYKVASSSKSKTPSRMTSAKKVLEKASPSITKKITHSYSKIDLSDNKLGLSS